MSRAAAFLFAGLVASIGGAGLFVVAVLENRELAAYAGISLTVIGALSAVIAAVISRRRTLMTVALVGFVPVTFVAWSIWSLVTDSS